MAPAQISDGMGVTGMRCVTTNGSGLRRREKPSVTASGSGPRKRGGAIGTTGTTGGTSALRTGTPVDRSATSARRIESVIALDVTFSDGHPQAAAWTAWGWPSSFRRNDGAVIQWDRILPRQVLPPSAVNE